MNAGLLIDLPHLDETGAQSIGLFRTELQFMLASRFPRLDAQEALYRARARRGRRADRVTFRTLDIGGDKVLPYMKALEEENPALGWRAIRIGLDKPALLRTQIARHAARRRRPRAAGDAADGVDRRRVRRGAGAARARDSPSSIRCGRAPPSLVELGAMVEVPSLLWQLDEIAAAADFLSVGSNDLHAISVTPPTATTSASPAASTRCRRPSCARLQAIAEAGARALASR